MVSQSEYHQAYWSGLPDRNGMTLTGAKMLNHSDEELEFLARLAGQRTAWQMSGKKAVKKVSQGY